MLSGSSFEGHSISFVLGVKGHRDAVRAAELQNVTVNNKGPKNANENSQRQGKRIKAKARDTECSRL